MSIDAEIVADRRRMGRSRMMWRALAILAVVVALISAGAASFGGDGIGIFGEHVARIRVEGLITGKREQLELIEKLGKAKRVRAVIVHINSPGGTTVGSEAVYEHLRGLAKKKPVVTVMGSQATSGGYITAIAGDHIVARGNTLTGSIGVIMQWPNAKELLDNIGIKYREVKSDPLKAAPNPFTDDDPEAIAVVRELIDDSHKWFVGLVAERRKLGEADARRLGNGRIFTGRQALDAKLIDGIGGEMDALNWLKEEKNLPKSIKVIDWKPKSTDELSFIRVSAQWFGEAFGGGLLDGVLSQAEKRLAPERLNLDGLISVWQPRE
ncbi:MAG: signal peptide peptidase SppA [Hyphomicrobiales bacterium]